MTVALMTEAEIRNVVQSEISKINISNNKSNNNTTTPKVDTSKIEKGVNDNTKAINELSNNQKLLLEKLARVEENQEKIKSLILGLNADLSRQNAILGEKINESLDKNIKDLRNSLGSDRSIIDDGIKRNRDTIRTILGEVNSVKNDTKKLEYSFKETNHLISKIGKDVISNIPRNTK